MGYVFIIKPRHLELDSMGREEEEERMETYFISHGSPMLALEPSVTAHGFLSRWKETTALPGKPRAILAISAHWCTSEPFVNTVTKNDTIHDFNNFPPLLYTLQYNAPGSPALAQRVKELLKSAGFKSVQEDPERGLDHGAWVPLYLMYPEADIPVVQLSVQPHKDGAHHFRMGQALAPLRDEGFLIMGSGSATHGPPALDLSNGSPLPWALSFDNWLNDSLVNGRFENVINYEEKAPNVKQVHQSAEHFYPLLVAMGAAGVGSKAERIQTSWMDSSLSMASFSFKPNP